MSGASVFTAEHICQVFHQLFFESHNTLLEGGFEEPVYVPGDPSRIQFREDYVSSALHEVAHWCYAGANRRRQRDYGYWYEPSRDELAQKRFESVEVEPQALECLFTEALGMSFKVSADNLMLPEYEAREFTQQVEAAVARRRMKGLTGRAKRFYEGLQTLAVLDVEM